MSEKWEFVSTVGNAQVRASGHTFVFEILSLGTNGENMLRQMIDLHNCEIGDFKTTNLAHIERCQGLERELTLARLVIARLEMEVARNRILSADFDLESKSLQCAMLRALANGDITEQQHKRILELKENE